MRLYIITGGIASGKSTVLEALAEKGVHVISADVLSRKVMEPGQKGYKQIVKAFGDEVVRPDKTLDRARLAKIIFSDETARRKLERITHPKIAALIGRQILTSWLRSDATTIVMVEIPLAFEARSYNSIPLQCVPIINISVSAATQLERLMDREGIQESEAELRIHSQLDKHIREENSDFIIQNDATKNQLLTNVNETMNAILRMHRYHFVFSPPLRVRHKTQTDAKYSLLGRLLGILLCATPAEVAVFIVGTALLAMAAKLR